MRIALAQLNTTVGDIVGNAKLACDAIEVAQAAGAALTVLPELTLAGYPPEDLLLRPEFARATRDALVAVARTVTRGVALVGFVDDDGGDCHNALAVCADGDVRSVYRKRFLPNYGVFDEARYFRAGGRAGVIDVNGRRVGLTICEDIWFATPVAAELAASNLDLIVCASASPFHLGKGAWRERMLATRAADASAPLAFCNQAGGQDELVFDGRSAVFDASGEVVARAKPFVADLIVVDLDLESSLRYRWREPRFRRITSDSQQLEPSFAIRADVPMATPLKPSGMPTDPSSMTSEAELWGALVAGVRDYVTKNRFRGVVIGLSGGIDSALTAVIAVDAIGTERVHGVAMPSRYSDAISLTDAGALGQALGIDVREIPIDPIVRMFESALKPHFVGYDSALAHENVQARCRGTLLMALSNAHGDLVLATGNKSEMSVGYSTLYGDMVGGFAPLRDVSKTWVYRLATWRNGTGPGAPIPVRTITRPPTAELRPGQLDSDSLPPYPELDRILEGYVEHDRDAASLAAQGLAADIVAKVIALVDRAEYKRRQGPPGIKVTARALGRDRRMPITNRYGRDAE